MQIEHLRYFIALERYKTIAKASQTVKTSPQNFSRVLKNIELEVGNALFFRTSNHIELTADGYCFLEFAKNTIRQYDLICNHSRNNRVGGAPKTRITIFSQYMITEAYLHDLIADFTEMYPTIAINNILTNQTVGAEKISEMKYAFGALLEDSSIYKMKSLVAHHELSPVFTLHPVMVLSKNHPLSKKESLSIHDFDNLTMTVVARHDLSQAETPTILGRFHLKGKVSFLPLSSEKDCYQLTTKGGVVYPTSLESFQKQSLSIREHLIALPISGFSTLIYTLIYPKNLPEDSPEQLFYDYILQYIDK